MHNSPLVLLTRTSRSSHVPDISLPARTEVSRTAVAMEGSFFMKCCCRPCSDMAAYAVNSVVTTALETLMPSLSLHLLRHRSLQQSVSGLRTVSTCSGLTRSSARSPTTFRLTAPSSTVWYSSSVTHTDNTTARHQSCDPPVAPEAPRVRDQHGPRSTTTYRN